MNSEKGCEERDGILGCARYLCLTGKFVLWASLTSVLHSWDARDNFQKSASSIQVEREACSSIALCKYQRLNN